MLERNVDKLFAESMAIEAEDAKQAGTVGFIARVLTQATMPHKAPSDHACKSGFLRFLNYSCEAIQAGSIQ